MKLLVIRHGIAEDREAFARTGRPDSERPLTSVGRRRMKRAARGMREAVASIDILATSPFQRARQTAEIVAAAYGDLEVIETPTLAGSGTAAVLEWLRTLTGGDTVAVVGHEPQLSELASSLVTGTGDPVLSLKKGAACLISFANEFAPGQGELTWLLSSKHLRRLARR